MSKKNQPDKNENITLITMKDIKVANPDYQLMTLPLYRDEAAKKIQMAFLSHKIRSVFKENKSIEDKKTAIDRYSYKTKRLEKNQFKGLTEPVDDGFYEATRQAIKDNRYDLINYNHPDFTRRLFGMLREGHINGNEMMTAKLMYDSLICFNSGTMPEEASKKFSRYALIDPKGPYQPASSISYWKENEHTSQWQTILETSEHKEELHYYTIDLPHHWMLELLYSWLLFVEKYKYKDKFYLDAFHLYIDSTDLSKKIKEKKHQQINEALNGSDCKNIRALKFFIQTQSSKQQKKILDKNNLSKTTESALLLNSIIGTNSQIPCLCISLSSDNATENSKPPVFSFILPTIATSNKLQSLLFREEAVLPIPTVGKIKTTMIRAYATIPWYKNNEVPFSDSLNILKKLYPMADTLKGFGRPVELIHPDVEKSSKIHSYECYDFLLSFHDSGLHTTRCAENYKGLFLKIAQILDEKAGFASAPILMSKAIWQLVDMDSSAGKVYRDNPEYLCNSFLSIGAIFLTANANVSKEKDDDYLLPYSLLQLPQTWEPFLFGKNPKNLWDYSLLYRNDELAEIFRQVNKLQYNIKNYLKYNNSNASIVEIILHDLLKTIVDDTVLKQLFIELNKLDLKNIFYWSKNEGLFFKKEFVEDLEKKGINPHLRSNAPALICEALLLIIERKNDVHLFPIIFGLCQYGNEIFLTDYKERLKEHLRTQTNEALSQLLKTWSTHVASHNSCYTSYIKFYNFLDVLQQKSLFKYQILENMDLNISLILINNLKFSQIDKNEIYTDIVNFYQHENMNDTEGCVKLLTMLSHAQLDQLNRDHFIKTVFNNYSSQTIIEAVSQITNTRNTSFLSYVIAYIAIVKKDYSIWQKCLVLFWNENTVKNLILLLTNESILFKDIAPILSSEKKNGMMQKSLLHCCFSTVTEKTLVLLEDSSVSVEEKIKSLLAWKTQNNQRSLIQLYFESDSKKFSTWVVKLLVKAAVLKRDVTSILKIEIPYYPYCTAPLLYVLAFKHPEDFKKCILDLLADDNISFEKDIKSLFLINNQLILNTLAQNSFNVFEDLILCLSRHHKISFKENIRPLLKMKERRGNPIIVGDKVQALILSSSCVEQKTNQIDPELPKNAVIPADILVDTVIPVDIPELQLHSTKTSASSATKNVIQEEPTISEFQEKTNSEQIATPDLNNVKNTEYLLKKTTLSDDEKKLTIERTTLQKLLEKDYPEKRNKTYLNFFPRQFGLDGSTTIKQLKTLLRATPEDSPISLEKIHRNIHRNREKIVFNENVSKKTGTDYVITELEKKFQEQKCSPSLQHI